jgi:uncharacterized protein (UPF0303 family)
MTDEIARLEALERTLEFDTFDQGTAWQLGTAAVEIIRERGLVLAVQIVIGDHVVFKAAVNGVDQDTDPWLAGKAAAAVHFESSTLRVRLRNDIDPSVTADIDTDVLRPHGGAVPIRVTGKGIVGTITLSGEPDTVDHEVAVAAIQRALAM